jgi:hypothetical protein
MGQAGHPEWVEFVGVLCTDAEWGPTPVAGPEMEKLFRLYLAGFEAGFEAGAAQEKDNARRDSAAARPHTDRANAAAVERLCATMRGLPAAPGWRVTTVWGTFDAG